MTLSALRSLLPRLALPCLILLAPPWVAAQAPASVGGRVLVGPGNSRPLAQAAVVLSPQTADAEGRATYPATMADAQGEFRFATVPPGTYSICVVVPTGVAALDPCNWPEHAVVVTLAPGQAVTDFVVRLERAARLRVRVDDPDRLVVTPARARAAQTAGNNQLEIGTWNAAGLRVAARLVADDAAGVDYELIVPRGRDLQLRALAEGLRVQDEAGEALGLARAVDLRVGLLDEELPTVRLRAVRP